VLEDQNGFTLSVSGSLTLSKDTALLFLSMILPLLASIALVLVALFVLVDKITDYRKAIFLSTVEGERLSRLETFRDLAQVPFALKTHVSELVKSAPASAHLQNKFKADLLKVISLFEIQERTPMLQYSRWACKVRKTPFTFKNTFLTSLRQFFALSSGDINQFTKIPGEDPDESDALESVGVQESFKTYLFKTIDTKFMRKVSFTNIALEQGLKRYNSTNSKPVEKPPICIGKSMLDNFKRDKYIEHGFEDTPAMFGSNSSQPGKNTTQNQPRQLQVVANVIKDKVDYVLQVNDVDPKSNSKNDLSCHIFDFVVVKSRDAPCDPRFGYVIRNVRTSETGQTIFELVSLDDGFEKLQLSSSHKTLTLNFEDPYTIDDNFIEYAFRYEELPHEYTSISILLPLHFTLLILESFLDPTHLNTKPWLVYSVVSTAPLPMQDRMCHVDLPDTSCLVTTAFANAEHLTKQTKNR
jgi:hypothetical protein